MPVDGAEWLERMSGGYLDGFVVEGGSAVKFAIGDEGRLRALTEGLREAAAARSLLFVEVDAADTKLHMIHDLFFALARSVDWEGTAQRLVEALFARNAYAWPRPGNRRT